MLIVQDDGKMLYQAKLLEEHFRAIQENCHLVITGNRDILDGLRCYLTLNRSFCVGFILL